MIPASALELARLSHAGQRTRFGEPVDQELGLVEEDIEQWLERARQAWRPGETGAQTLRRARRAA